jgi:hypothetical protein
MAVVAASVKHTMDCHVNKSCILGSRLSAFSDALSKLSANSNQALPLSRQLRQYSSCHSNRNDR